MISKDKTYKTRGGLDVIIYAVYPDQVWGVHGAISANNGSEWISFNWQNDGNICDPKNPTDKDLVEVKPKVKYEKWFVLNKDTSYTIHSSKEEAVKYMKESFKKCHGSEPCAIKKVSFEYEIGEGL